MNVRNFIKNELSGWKAWEVSWLFVACSAILGLSLYWNDSWFGIISAVTGVACVVCTGKGKLSSYLFGTINVVLYSYISFQAKYYGEVMLNLIYYLPMEFIGFYVWKKHMNSQTYEVDKKRMSRKGRFLVAIVVVLSTTVYGSVLRLLGGALPFVDALSTVISVIAMVISVKMYMEQWFLWIIVDIVTVVMWLVAFMRGNDSIATLVMWTIYLGNAIIMHIKWAREVTDHAV